jgi:hypothetical protein
LEEISPQELKKLLLKLEVSKAQVIRQMVEIQELKELVETLQRLLLIKEALIEEKDLLIADAIGKGYTP